MTRAGAVAVLSCFVIACDSAPRESPAEYLSRVERHRAERSERLRSEDGWLTLVGLHWLEPGTSTFGSDEANAVVLNVPDLPGQAGSLHYDGKAVRLVTRSETGVTIDGEAVTDRVLRPDTDESTDIVHVGRARFHVVERNGRHAIRVKDPLAATRTGFAGLDFFPIDEDWRVSGTFEAYDEPRDVVVATAVGTTSPMRAFGTVRFEHSGRGVTLEPYADSSEDTELWFIFKDRTSGTTTYGAGRYLYATRTGNRVDVDFNLAYNPPCAFTPFATCPLPPRDNWLDIAVEAGERLASRPH